MNAKPVNTKNVNGVLRNIANGKIRESALSKKHKANHLPTQIANMCLQGGRIAYQAYSKGTFDAKYPDMPKLYYLIDYYGEQSPFPYSKQHAIGSVKQYR